VRLGNLESRRDYTDVLDVAAALHRLLSTSPPGTDTFNLGSGNSVSVAQLVQICEEILSRAIKVEVDAGRFRTTDRAELVADPSLLRETTGWKPTRFLRETVAELLTEPEVS
jgi:GDP-4-dehydro-6-deoxy-D-mannose reductase